MLKKHHQIFASILILTDFLVAGGAWAASYGLRYGIEGFTAWLEVRGYPSAPPFSFREHLLVLPVILAVTYFCYKGFGLYLPRRTRSLPVEAFDVLRATLAAFLVTVAAVVFLFHEQYARLQLAFHFALTATGSIGTHLALRGILHRLRARGKNLRHVLVVGAGRLGQSVVQRLTANPWMGLRPVGYLDDDPEREGKSFDGVPVLGGFDRASEVIRDRKIDQVFCALPFEQQGGLPALLDTLTEETVDVRIIPDLTSFSALNASVGEFDGLPMINLRESPLYGWNRVLKRAIDILFSALFLVLAAVPMAIIALLIKLTSKGSILYRQERMGLDGRTFDMLKFRTMRIDAEAETGAVWAKENDPRRTRFGSFLRRSSLDELPQFWNVLKGEMSLVGPRPERPVFIEDFKKTVPRYMLRHKMKAGITGWAQINGWRGNTSLEKRIQYDLYYIENWSLGFDLRILFLTPFKGLVSRNAY